MPMSGTIDLMIRITKIKKSWSTSVNKKMIGEGDQFKRLFANSCKLFLVFLLYLALKFTHIMKEICLTRLISGICLLNSLI